MKRKFLLLSVTAIALALPARSEWLELVNGDRYSGKVTGVHEDVIEFQSEVQGPIKLPRAKVAAIYFHTTPPRKGAAPAGALPDLPRLQTNQQPVVKPPPGAGADLKSLQDLQQELAASPEAKQMFNDLVSGVFSGNVSIQDLRAQALQAVRQMEEMKGELGEEAGSLFDGYLSILNNFLKQSDTNALPKTNSHPKPPPHAAPP